MAAQPPRPPPNNLLFCGPPPALPHVVLLPSDVVSEICDLNATSDASLSQTNDAPAFNEINNVGIPTYETLYENQVDKDVFQNDMYEESRYPPGSYLRRTHSFDITDIFTSPSDVDFSVLRHRRSEPDLSKYGLFVEAEVTVEPYGPLQPAPLVLNNPFYDGSYALDPNQINNTMVVLPENYLAFEDSFVPTWDYKPELLVDCNFNPELYYDRLPMIPPNDPWSAYGNENSAFEYYSPHFETPLGNQDAIHYMPLTDLEYAIPQYMSLPVVEQAKVETFTDNNNLTEDLVTPSIDSSSEITKECTNLPQEELEASAIESTAISEDEKLNVVENLTNRESSTQSEESINADISNDVTSSLAFVPSSKCSPQRSHGIGADDTSNDTSPCSTDYHEASALDIVQSLDELSCCDSDYSQSRDDTSPVIPDHLKGNTVVSNEKNKESAEVNDSVTTSSSMTMVNLPLSQLPSIPLHEPLPVTLPLPPSSKLPEKEVINSEPSNTVNVKLVEPVSPASNDPSSSDSARPLERREPEEAKVVSNNKPVLRPAPHPPSVPPAWLAPKRPFNDVAASENQSAPQIRVQNAEGQPVNIPKSPKPSTQAPAKVNLAGEEPQPSCSFQPPRLPPPVAQLKPDKQPKEVEVRFIIKIKYLIPATQMK